MRTPHAATELDDGPKPEAAAPAKQPEDLVPAELNGPPAEPSDGQPADPGAAQAATEADALGGTSSAGVCASGQLSSRPPSTDIDQFEVCNGAYHYQCHTCNTLCAARWAMQQSHSL